MAAGDCGYVPSNVSPVPPNVSTSTPPVSLNVSRRGTRLRARPPMIASTYTYLWQSDKVKPRNKYLPPPTKGGKVGPGQKRAIVSLVERGGSVRSFHVENADKATINQIVAGNVARETRLHTDESRIYNDALQHVSKQETVCHSAGEYVRGDI